MQNIDLSFFPSKVRFSTAVTESARELGTKEKSVNVWHHPTPAPPQTIRISKTSHFHTLYFSTSNAKDNNQETFFYQSRK